MLAESPTSTIDTFHRAKIALEGYFDIFFDFPIDLWLVMPVFTLTSAMWSISILARWAKVMGPARSCKPSAPDILTPQKVIWDPSALRPIRNTTFGSGLAPAPNFDADEAGRDGFSNPHEHAAAPGSHTRSRTAKTPIPPTITHPSQIPAGHVHDFSQPDLAQAVAQLKDRLHGQLNVDVIGILSRMAQLCSLAHAKLVEASPDGSWHNDVWWCCEKKMLIGRAKLEKWAEIIAAGGVVAQPLSTTTAGVEGRTRPEREAEQMGDGAAVAACEPSPAMDIAAPFGPLYPPETAKYFGALSTYQRQIETAGVDASPADAMYEPDMYGSVWNDSIFDPLDPSLWLYDGNDWNATVFGGLQDVQPGF